MPFTRRVVESRHMKRFFRSLFLTAAAIFLGAGGAPDPGNDAAEVYVVRVDGAIGDRAAAYVERVVSEAEEEGGAGGGYRAEHAGW
jgi:membrane-bound ClpP family serine protease